MMGTKVQLCLVGQKGEIFSSIKFSFIPIGYGKAKVDLCRLSLFLFSSKTRPNLLLLLFFLFDISIRSSYPRIHLASSVNKLANEEK